jgi:hypothetical protein
MTTYMNTQNDLHNMSLKMTLRLMRGLRSSSGKKTNVGLSTTPVMAAVMAEKVGSMGKQPRKRTSKEGRL